MWSTDKTRRRRVCLSRGRLGGCRGSECPKCLWDSLGTIVTHTSFLQTQTMIYEAHWTASCNRHTAGTFSFSFAISAHIKHQTDTTHRRDRAVFFFFNVGFTGIQVLWPHGTLLRQRLKDFSSAAVERTFSSMLAPILYHHTKSEIRGVWRGNDLVKDRCSTSKPAESHAHQNCI